MEHSPNKGIGPWVANRKHVSRSVDTLRFQVEERDLNIGEVIRLLHESEAFRQFFSEMIIDSSFAAFFWEVVPISKATIESPFEFAQSNASSLTEVVGDPGPFSNQFETDKTSPILAFPNLGGDATLIVPRKMTENSSYGHLAAFLRLAPQSQVGSFWKLVGETIQSKMGPSPIWLSTAGMEVSWLHLRLDSRPKYYRYAPYKDISIEG